MPLTTPSAPTVNVTAQPGAAGGTFSVQVQNIANAVRDAGSALSSATSISPAANQTFVVSPPSTADPLYTHYDVYVGGKLVTPTAIPKSMAFIYDSILAMQNDGTRVASIGSVGGGGSTGLGDGTAHTIISSAPSGGM